MLGNLHRWLILFLLDGEVIFDDLGNSSDAVFGGLVVVSYRLDGLESSHHVVFNDAPVFSGLQFVLHCLGALPNDASTSCGLLLNLHVCLFFRCCSISSFSCNPSAVVMSMLINFPSLSLGLGASMLQSHSSSCFGSHLISLALVISLVM